MLPFSTAAFEGAVEGIRVFGGTVLPSLFPFAVCANYISNSGILSGIRSRFGKLIPFFSMLLAWLCGTPSAAVITCRLYKDGSYDTKRASILCAAWTQMGPLFILSGLCGGMLNCREYAPVFYVSIYLPSLAVTILSGFPKAFKIKGTKDTVRSSLPSSVSEAVMSMLRVGGTIVFFNVLFSVFSSFISLRGLSVPMKGFLFGSFELTNGLIVLSSEPSRLSLSICAFVLSFGGISVFVQSRMLFPELSPAPYLLTKLLLGLASGIIAWLFLPFFTPAVETIGNLSESMSGVASSLPSKAASVFLSLIASGFALVCSVLYSKLAVRK